MSSAVSALIPQLANYNPTGFATENLLRSQQLGLNAVQAQRVQQETALQQQQTQQTALQNQLVQQQIADQKAIGRAWAGWDPDQDPSGQGLLKTAVRNGATPQSVMGVQQHLAQYNASLATADKTRLENAKTRADDFAGKIQAIIEADPKDQDGLIAQYKGALLADDPAAQIPDHFGINEFKALQKVHQYQSVQTDQALKNQQTKEAAAGAQLKEAETEKQNNINALLKQGQQAVQIGQHPIDAILSPQDDPGLNASLKAMYDRGARFVNPNTGISELQEQALKTAAEFKHEISKVNNPTIRAGEVTTAVNKAAAEAPIHTAQAVATEKATAPIKTQIAVATQRALNSTAAVGNVPPHLIPQYQGEVAKVASAYGDAANAANEMQEMIDLMRSGNKIAYAYSPTTGVLTINSANGTKRVNTTEIGQYAGAGSLLDRVTGYFGKQLTGESVPSDIVDAMEQVHGTLGEGARNSAVAKIKSLNAQYGATTDPEAILVKPTKATAPLRGAAAPGKYKAGDTRVINGTTYVRNEQGQWLPR